MAHLLVKITMRVCIYEHCFWVQPVCAKSGHGQPIGTWQMNYHWNHEVCMTPAVVQEHAWILPRGLGGLWYLAHDQQGIMGFLRFSAQFDMAMGQNLPIYGFCMQNMKNIVSMPEFGDTWIYLAISNHQMVSFRLWPLSWGSWCNRHLNMMKNSMTVHWGIGSAFGCA